MRTSHSAIILLTVLLNHLLPQGVATCLATEATYYYAGKRKTFLPQAERISDRGMLFRSGRSGPVRIADENFYVVYPPAWDNQARDRFEQQHRLVPSAIPPHDAIHFYRASSAEEALAVANHLVEETPVAGSAPLWIKQVARRSAGADDPLFPAQWHLLNTGQSGGVAGEDLNLAEVWQHHDGHGVMLGIVDDGLELGHPDLVANIAPLLQYDYVENDSDPTAGSHGTSVAGVAAAVGANGIGGRGVAPAAQLVGLRLLDDSGFVDELAEAEIFRNRCREIDIFNNSWGPPDNQNGAFTGPSPLARAAMDSAIAHGRDGLGSIFVWAAGNGGSTDNSNLDGYANLRYTIAVTATTNTGQAAPYAEPGANILVNAPSGGGFADITTTDRSGRSGDNPGGSAWDLADPDYTANFSGTSAATAMVSGVVALLLEAKPDLNWREVQAVLAMSAHQNDPRHSSWRHNGAGFAVSTQYGFGRVDAGAALATALGWNDPMAPEVASSPYFSNVRREIPDNDPAGITDSVAVVENLRIESVEVTVNIPDHPYWGDIDIRLMSPAGTEIQLATPRYLNPVSPETGYHMWTMGDVLHGGETSKGTWHLKVVDREAEDSGTLYSWSMTFHGTALPTATTALPLLCSPRDLDSGAILPRPAGLIAAGVNHHGSLFQQTVSGTRHEDFMLVAGIKNVSAATLAHAVALHETSDGDVTMFVKTGDGWMEWSGPPEELPGFSPAALMAEEGAVLFHGRLAPGRYAVHTGYTSSEGELLYCAEPLRLTVE